MRGGVGAERLEKNGTTTAGAHGDASEGGVDAGPSDDGREGGKFAFTI